MVGGKMEDIKDIQLQILGQTIANLHMEIAELRATVIVQNNALQEFRRGEESDNGEHQDSTTDRTDNNC